MKEIFCGEDIYLNYCPEISGRGTTECGVKCSASCKSGQCITTNTSYYYSYNQCDNGNCSKFTNMSFTMSACPNKKDYYGFSCQCCLNDHNVAIKIPQCLTNWIDRDGNISQYAKERIVNKANLNIFSLVSLFKKYLDLLK